MSISRRDFFVETFGKALEHAAMLFPASVRDILDFSNTTHLSPDEAAFELVKHRRKAPSTKSVVSDCPMDKPTLEIGQQADSTAATASGGTA